MFYRHSLIQRPKATVIIFGLLATLAIPLYGHSPPPAESCKGWECDNPGQLCGPGVPGAGTVQQASVVPDHDVASRPFVVVYPRRLAREVDQLSQKRF